MTSKIRILRIGEFKFEMTEDAYAELARRAMKLCISYEEIYG